MENRETGTGFRRGFRRLRRFCFSCPFFSPGVSRPPELEWRIGMETGKADEDDAYLEIER